MTPTTSGKRDVPPYITDIQAKLKQLDRTARLGMLSSGHPVSLDNGTICNAADKLLMILLKAHDGRAIHKLDKAAIAAPPYEFIDGISKSLERVIGPGFDLSIHEEPPNRHVDQQRGKMVIVLTLQLLKPAPRP